MDQQKESESTGKGLDKPEITSEGSEGELEKRSVETEDWGPKNEDVKLEDKTEDGGLETEEKSESMDLSDMKDNIATEDRGLESGETVGSEDRKLEVKEEVKTGDRGLETKENGRAEDLLQQETANAGTLESTIATPVLPPAAPDPESPPQHVSPLIIVLQWLTYAFWGWVIVALGSLIVSVLAYFIAGSDVSGFVPYGIAAVLVLLPIASVCDLFYTKREPAKKTGASAVVMVIHAVIFALLGIGALITGVFMLVNVVTDSALDANAQVALLSAIIITALYAAAFLRTINPFKQKVKLMPRIFTVFMCVMIGLAILITIIGPVAKARTTRDDRIIESGLDSVSQAINSYANKNGALPNTLDDIELTENETDAKSILQRKLATYKPNTKDAVLQSNSLQSSLLRSGSRKTFYYQLCVNYKEKSNYSYRSPFSYVDDGYESYLSTSGHPAGPYCYKLKTSYY